MPMLARCNSRGHEATQAVAVLPNSTHTTAIALRCWGLRLSSRACLQVFKTTADTHVTAATTLRLPSSAMHQATCGDQKHAENRRSSRSRMRDAQSAKQALVRGRGGAAFCTRHRPRRSRGNCRAAHHRMLPVFQGKRSVVKRSYKAYHSRGQARCHTIRRLDHPATTGSRLRRGLVPGRLTRRDHGLISIAAAPRGAPRPGAWPARPAALLAAHAAPTAFPASLLVVTGSSRRSHVGRGAFQVQVLPGEGLGHF